MSELFNIIGDYELFLEKLFRDLKASGIDLLRESSELDHLAYRVETVSRYEELKSEFSKIGTSISENIINGRPISIFVLHKPVDYEGWIIKYIELPSPKQGSPYLEGLEHAEFVLRSSFGDFMSQHQNLKFDTSNSGDVINPDVKLSFDGYSVKFHLKPIDEVVRLQDQS